MAKTRHSPVFTITPPPGWIAHAREQAATGKPIRPQLTHIGPPPLTAD